MKRGAILDDHSTTRYPNSIPDSIPARIYTRKVGLELAEEILEFFKTH